MLANSSQWTSTVTKWSCAKKLESLIAAINFGPNKVCVPSKSVKDMIEDEPNVYKNILEKDKGVINRLSPSIKLQILFLCFHTFLTEVVGRS